MCLDQAISGCPSSFTAANVLAEINQCIPCTVTPKGCFENRPTRVFRVRGVSSSTDHYIGPLNIIFRFLGNLTVLVGECLDINNSQRALDNQEKMTDERPKLEQAKMAKSNVRNSV